VGLWITPDTVKARTNRSGLSGYRASVATAPYARIVTPDLSRFLGRLLRLAAATPDERAQLILAVGGSEVRSLADLPADAQQLVAELQARADRRHAETKKAVLNGQSIRRTAAVDHVADPPPSAV
jgi:hypothetical protein